MNEVVELREAVAGLVNDGDSVALEGLPIRPRSRPCTVMRQRPAGSKFVRMAPDLESTNLLQDSLPAGGSPQAISGLAQQGVS